MEKEDKEEKDTVDNCDDGSYHIDWDPKINKMRKDGVLQRSKDAPVPDTDKLVDSVLNKEKVD